MEKQRTEYLLSNETFRKQGDVMRSHRLFVNNITKIWIGCLLLAVAVIWNEWLSFELSSLGWDVSAPIPGAKVRMLIVADPQLIGYEQERVPFASITRWDADRYLHLGFSRALRASKPDVVLFLGDLFDEGVTMSASDFKRTVKRFRSIFAMPRTVQSLFVPGDNDIGGEVEAVRPYLLERFLHQFQNTFKPGDIGLDGFKFIHLNAFNGNLNTVTNGSSELTVIISHAPVLRTGGSFQKILNILKPVLILSAHDHLVGFYRQNRDSTDFVATSVTDYFGSVETVISKNEPIAELQTPTCSYRMGVSHAAYGLMTFTQNEDDPLSYRIRYSVLWLPRRFHQLAFYIFAVAFFLLCLVKSGLHRLFRSYCPHFVRSRFLLLIVCVFMIF